MSVATAACLPGDDSEGLPLLTAINSCTAGHHQLSTPPSSTACKWTSGAEKSLSESLRPSHHLRPSAWTVATPGLIASRSTTSQPPFCGFSPPTPSDDARGSVRHWPAPSPPLPFHAYPPHQPHPAAARSRACRSEARYPRWSWTVGAAPPSSEPWIRCIPDASTPDKHAQDEPVRYRVYCTGLLADRSGVQAAELAGLHAPLTKRRCLRLASSPERQLGLLGLARFPDTSEPSLRVEASFYTRQASLLGKSASETLRGS